MNVGHAQLTVPRPCRCKRCPGKAKSTDHRQGSKRATTTTTSAHAPLPGASIAEDQSVIMKQQNTSHVVLTPATAVQIYRAKQGKTRQDAARLGARFGVSAKAVRDIWRRRTWPRATKHLWTDKHSCPARPESLASDDSLSASLSDAICPSRSSASPCRQDLGNSAMLSSRPAAAFFGMQDFGNTDNVDMVWQDIDFRIERDLSRTREEAVTPDDPVFTGEQLDGHGWIKDPKLIAYFTSYPKNVDEVGGESTSNDPEPGQLFTYS